MSPDPAAVHRALAPAKVNLGLCLGPRRQSDGRHELVTVMQSISLADVLTLEPAPAGARGDELCCPGVSGPPAENLAARALSEFRARTGWEAAPLRVRIDKRIPVAAGLAGGSADAAAVLRLARHASGLGEPALLREIAAGLGADVPAQLEPGRWLATGAGELLGALPDPAAPLGVLLLPGTSELSTAAVYQQADRLALARPHSELERHRGELARALAHGEALPADGALLHNDLQRAAVSLLPEIAETLSQARAAGGEVSLVCGSGPTVAALFDGPGGEGRLRDAAAELAGRVPAVIEAKPVAAGFAAAATVDAPLRA